jgi:hypothetical protein
MIVSVKENGRDISLTGELFVGRTGAPAGNFYTYRTGVDRLRNASRGIVSQLSAALPFWGKLIQRRQSQGLINKGKADGIKSGTVYDIVKKGRPQLLNTGIGVIYSDDDLVGRITIENVGEEASSGTLVRNGFFDRIEEGDDIILKAANDTKSPPETASNPELQAILRTLR